MDVLLYGIGGFILSFLHYYCWNMLSNANMEYKSIKLWSVILVMDMFINISTFYLIPFLKIVFSFIFLILICYYFVNRNLKISICLVLFSQLILMLSELTFVIMDVVVVNYDMVALTSMPIGNVILNIYNLLFTTLFLKTNIPKKIFDKVVSLINYMKQKEVIIYSIMIIIVSIISTAESYMNLPLSVVLTTNTVMTLIFIFIILKFAVAEDKYARTNSKYQVSITSLREYQEILDKFRVSTHENKNQLLTIKTMVKDPKVISYIEAIIDEKTKDNEKIMNKAYKIPDDRFRSLIYQKLCKIDELKIKYKFTISNDVKTADLIDMDDYLVANACSILGVYLDNAIEAVKDLKKKNIFLEIYIMDGYLCFDITNNFEGILDIDKLFKPKYTTKGEKHGYGLSVVSKIVKENDNIDNECEINKDMITQRLKVKM